MKRVFYDIESLEDVFTVAIWHPDGIPHAISYANLKGMFSQTSYRRIFGQRLKAETADELEHHPTLDVYVLKEGVTFSADDPLIPRITQRIFAKNPVLRTIARELRLKDKPSPYDDIVVRIFDLHDKLCAAQLIMEFGMGQGKTRVPFRVQNPDNPQAFMQSDAGDTPFDFEGDNVDHDVYLMGYNSYNYDTTMLAYYISHIVEIEDSAHRINEKKHLIAAREHEQSEHKNGYQRSQNSDYLRFIQECQDDIDAAEADIDALRDTDNVAHIDDKKFDAVTPAMLRNFNDILFSDAFRRQMPAALAFPDSSQWGDAYISISGNTQKYSRPQKAHKDWTKALCQRFCKDVNSLPLPKFRNYTLPEHQLRQFWLRSGRHIDVARLNEKQQRVGLKRLLGVIGRQIFEDPSVVAGQTQDVENLVAYNASDVINLQYIFENGAYRAPFDNKGMILDEYPETVFDDPTLEGDALTDPSNIRNDRLRVDSTSQQIISTALCPNRRNPLLDNEKVELTYPHPITSKETGIKPRDILEESSRFFYTQVLPTVKPEYQALAFYQFERAYQHYSWLREQNLNSGSAYQKAFNDAVAEPPTDAPGIGTCLLYFNDHGEPSSCYAIVSEGGIHGAEYDKRLFEEDLATYKAAEKVLRTLKDIFGEGDDGATNMLNTGVKIIRSDHIRDPETGEVIIFDDGKPRCVYDVVMSKSTRKRAYWKRISRPKLFRTKRIMGSTENRIAGTGFPKTLDLTDNNSHIHSVKQAYGSSIDFAALIDEINADEELYPLKFRSDELNERYAYTSAATVNHEDFASYYPNLLRQMRAFFNPELGVDRYGELFNQKQEFGRYQKDPTLAPSELQERITDLPLDEKKRYWTRRRNGVKLMLNAGSGAGGAAFDNTIRMNNNIMAMRMIGQLFTWRIGQAQALNGALVPSTNTDGLYTVMEASANNAILEHEAATIGVDIEPEIIQLVSKDANNRVEYEPVEGFTSAIEETDDKLEYHPERVHIVSAGGSLSCYRGPSTENSLDHPAIYDYVIAHYIIAIKEGAEWEHRLAHSDEPIEDYVDRWFRCDFDEGLARSIMDSVMQKMHTKRIVDQVHVIRMFQTMVASSPGTFSFVVERRYDPTDGSSSDFQNMQHYNRAFFVAPERVDPDANLHLAYLSKCMARKKQPNQTSENEFKGKAAKLLREMGLSQATWETDGREPAIVKLPKVEEDQLVAIENGDLYVMGDSVDDDGVNELEHLFEALDIDAYIAAIKDIYNKNWRNGNVPAPNYADIAYASPIAAQKA